MVELKHLINDTNSFETRIAAFETKCRDISRYSQSEVPQENEKQGLLVNRTILTLEQRFEILERKFDSIIYF